MPKKIVAQVKDEPAKVEPIRQAQDEPIKVEVPEVKEIIEEVKPKDNNTVSFVKPNVVAPKIEINQQHRFKIRFKDLILLHQLIM